MRIHSALAAILLVLGSAVPSFALDDAVSGKVMEKAVDQFIKPGYARFHVSATTLAEETGKWCTDPDAAQLSRVQDAFTKTARDWARIEIVRLGPVLEKNRFERVLFYPDRKSIGLKQVQALLAKPDESVTDPAKLATKSVAIQGLGAFEFLFFGFYPEGLIAKKNSFHCRYGLAIARNVETIAADLDRIWSEPDGVQNDWKQPGPTNALYRDHAEAIAALIGVHVHGVEYVRDQRIKAFYKGKNGKTLPKAALFWRSANTMPVIEANLAGLDDLWKVSDMRSLLGEDAGSLADAVEFDYKTARQAVEKLIPPSREALDDKAYQKRLEFIEFTLKDAIARIDKDVAGTIGLGAGFSFADGD
jgi:predicted lipoprotein